LLGLRERRRHDRLEEAVGIWDAAARSSITARQRGRLLPFGSGVDRLGQRYTQRCSKKL